MKILVAILTRKRPIALTALVYALDALAKFPERVTYAVRADDDDPHTYEAAQRMARDGGLPVVYGHGERYPGLGQIWNETLAQTARSVDWDVCYLASDGYVPVSQSWDVVLESFFNEPTRAACSWTELNDPTNPTHIIITRKWYDALQGKVCPENPPFVFWFAGDTWLREVHELAFGKPIPILDRLVLAGRRGTTNGMRDLAFWFSAFNRSRTQRLTQAFKLANAYGVTAPNPAPLFELMEKRDEYQLSQVPVYEQAFRADTTPPNERYLIAKALAEEYLCK